MKRVFLLLVLLSVSIVSMLAAKKIVQDGLQFVLSGTSTVSCKADDKNALVDVVIPAKVYFDKKPYVVTDIGYEGFKDCKNLKTIVLPNTLERIRAKAFWNCISLESVVLPDECKADIWSGSYGYDRYGVFHGCTALQRMRGTKKLYPVYMVFDALFDCEEVPFYDNVKDMSQEQLESFTLYTNFTDFAIPRVKQAVEGWQKRKPYETFAQWESRVNEENRKKMIQEAIAEAHAEFIKIYSPGMVQGVIEDYNAEYGFYTVYLGELGNVYAYVPETEAQEFADHWSEVKIHPNFGIMDNGVGVLSCDFSLNGKTYKAPKAYAEDEFDDVAMAVTPLSAVREYEKMVSENGDVRKPGLQIHDIDMIDIDIPQSQDRSANTFAVIIGNENYQRVAHVDYALNDARILAKYFNQTLGIPEENIRTYLDATFGDIVAAIADIDEICKAYGGKAKVIFYYAGHGVPDEGNRNAYLLPIDANGSQLETCYPLGRLYEQLSALQAESVVTLIDACFSGSLRGDGMLASTRGIKLKPRDVKVNGNMVVFTAASGDQSALPFPEKNHGLFTYFLLCKLHDTKGELSLGELSDYLKEEVAKQAIVVNKKPQTPDVKYSPMLTDSWQEIRFK